jgi:hypothetical protein
MQPVLDRELARHRDHGPALRGTDLGPVLAFARKLLAKEALTGAQLRAALADEFPQHSAAALAYACRNLVALVQVPPRGLWDRSGQVRVMTAEAWLDRALVTNPSIDDAVLRYFATFGPATVADVAAWSALTAMREVVDRVRGHLVVLRDERGRELFDIPDAPRPDPDIPAPPRFLPEYDNVLLSHADRTRFMSEERRRQLSAAGGPVHGSLLFDGAVIATWWLARDDATATLGIRHGERLSRRAMDAIDDEGLQLLALLQPDAHEHKIRYVALD